MAIYFLLVLIVVSSVYLVFSYYFKNTIEEPGYGGEYTEAMVGQPRFINPVLSQTNDIDSDLSSLVYSSLLKLDENGNFINDLAEDYEISEDKLTYTFHIKKNVKWHDGENLSADDIIYTLQTIQNKDLNSPLRTSWKGIRAEKIDDYTINFTLKNSYSPFLNNLTFGIIPKHLWEYIGSGNFSLAEYNLSNPKGSGIYKFNGFSKDKEGRISMIELVANEDYYGKVPYIKKLKFKFFQTEEDAISAYNRKEVNGMNYLSGKNLKKIIDFENSNEHKLNMPRYFAVFFNQTKSKSLSDKAVRIALAHSVDREKLVENILLGNGTVVNSPIPPQAMGHSSDVKTYEYSIDKAKETLDEAGWTDENEDGIREKEDVKLEFTLVSTDWPELKEVSEMLKNSWKEIGAEVKIKNLDINEIQNNYIKQRSYEAILFGEILNYDPDPFAFWHSSQKKDPGLNLSLYDNTEVDKLLEEARQEVGLDARKEKYAKFQGVVVEEIPALFLYSPYYIYIQNKSVKNVEVSNIVIPSNRFNGIENWYVKTKRVWK